MNMQSQRDIQTENIKTAENRPGVNWLLNLMRRHFLRKVFRRLNQTGSLQRSAVPTEAQRNLILTGLVLGFVSIFTAIFPICGFPAALTGLLIGAYGRRATSLQVM